MGACRIRTVHANSPAQKAGVRSEDIVVRFGGTKVTSFDSLQKLIAARDVNDEVEMDVIRERGDDGGPFQPITTHVKLAPWDVDTAVQNPRR
jgi:S1-C subfamily serine protease